MYNRRGFTLIELLIVIVIIGVLSSVLISVINPRRAQGAARDGVRMANIEKLAQAIEAYGAAEGSYPVSIAYDATTFVPTDPTISEYIKVWPSPSAANYEYTYKQDASDNAHFVIKVKTERGTDSCIKYGSKVGKIYQCRVCESNDSATCTNTY